MSTFNTLFKIVVCELFHPLVFGVDENSDPTINGHFIVLNTYKRYKKKESNEEESDEEESDENYQEEIVDTSTIYEIVEKDLKIFNKQRKRSRRVTNHPYIRNYNKIVKQNLKFEIAYCVTLSGDEYVAILKTFWKKIIIRAFKKAFKKKMWFVYLNRLKGKIPINKPLLKGLLV